MGLEKRDQFLLIVVQFGLSVALQAPNVKDLEKCFKKKKEKRKQSKCSKMSSKLRKRIKATEKKILTLVSKFLEKVKILRLLSEFSLFQWPYSSSVQNRV